jgi:hypothetical protein
MKPIAEAVVPMKQRIAPQRIHINGRAKRMLTYEAGYGATHASDQLTVTW